MREHTPTRPDWTCRECGEDWPCGARRAELADEPAVSVAVFLAACLSDAVRDLPGVPVDVLAGRFLGVIPRRVAIDGPENVFGDA